MTSNKFSNSFIISTGDTAPDSIPVEREASVFIASYDVFADTDVTLEESKRALEMSSLLANNAFLAGRRLVRRILSQWLLIDPIHVPIILTTEGRPVLAGESMPFFSITHSGETVMAVFSGIPVGIDLELERPLDFTALARRFFSREEAEAIYAENNPSLFFRLWTCREAAIKGDGRGLGRLLSLTKVTLEGERGARVTIGKDDWSVVHGMVDRNQHAALASSSELSVIRWCDLR